MSDEAAAALIRKMMDERRAWIESLYELDEPQDDAGGEGDSSERAEPRPLGVSAVAEAEAGS